MVFEVTDDNHVEEANDCVEFRDSRRLSTSPNNLNTVINLDQHMPTDTGPCNN